MASKICYKASSKLCYVLFSLDNVKLDKHVLLGLITYSTNPTHPKDLGPKLEIDLFGECDSRQRVFARKSNSNQSDRLLQLDFLVFRWYDGFSARCSEIAVRSGEISVWTDKITTRSGEILRNTMRSIKFPVEIKSPPWPDGFDRSMESWSFGGQRPVWPQLATNGAILDLSWSGRWAIWP